MIRRSVDDGELAFYHCYNPRHEPVGELVRVAGTRWPIEECFQTGKGNVGLDNYQVRLYHAWYRHITLAMTRAEFPGRSRAPTPREKRGPAPNRGDTTPPTTPPATPPTPDHSAPPGPKRTPPLRRRIRLTLAEIRRLFNVRDQAKHVIHAAMRLVDLPPRAPGRRPNTSLPTTPQDPIPSPVVLGAQVGEGEEVVGEGGVEHEQRGHRHVDAVALRPRRTARPGGTAVMALPRSPSRIASALTASPDSSPTTAPRAARRSGRRPRPAPRGRRRSSSTATPLGGQLVDERLHLGLGADVDAAGRLVEQAAPRVWARASGRADLLLVAAGELADLLVRAGRLDPRAAA